MARIILITGGSRSGKSAYAQGQAEALSGRRLFVATCMPTDDEMRERIRKHKQARSSSRWKTIEEPADLAGALRAAENFDVVVVDCLTLWINNLMHRASEGDEEITEDTMAGLCGELTEVCRKHSGTVIFVTNEVGMGIVPDNAAARLFRDLAGRCGQAIAEAADEVIFMVSGQPLHVKKGSAS